jgi:hypothetical protein
VPTKNSFVLNFIVLSTAIAFWVMLPVLVPLLTMLRDSLRSRVALQAEILALRHQLLVLQRRTQKQRLRLSVLDRLLWVWLSRIWPGWRAVLRSLRAGFLACSARCAICVSQKEVDPSFHGSSAGTDSADVTPENHAARL